MKINSPKIKLIGVVLILSFVVAVAGCTEKAGSAETQTTGAQNEQATSQEKTVAPSQHVSEKGFTTYSGVNYDIDYPDTWAKADLVGGLTAFRSPLSDSEDEFAENLIVTTDPKNIYTNLDQYISLSLVELKTLDNFILLENSKITLSGQPARKLVYTYENADLGALVKNVQIIALKNTESDSTSYIITYGGTGADFDKYWLDAQKMVDSFVMK